MFGLICMILSATCAACAVDDIVNHIPLDQCAPVAATWFAVFLGLLGVCDRIRCLRGMILEKTGEKPSVCEEGEDEGGLI